MGSHSSSGQSDGKVARAERAALDKFARYGLGSFSQP